MFDLPASTFVDRIIPKAKFYERTHVSTTIRDEFTYIIGRITWRHKLSESTLNIPETASVHEIQIFHIELKQKAIPQKALTIIDKSIPYPILFILTHQQDTCYVIQHKIDARRRYYKTDWNQLPSISFTGTTLESIYQRIITGFILVDEDLGQANDQSFDNIIAINAEREQLQKEIAVLENKIRSERQFSKKVALNTELQQKKHKLNQLT
ncbi:MAG: hypothetical protein QG549_195 [Patescibacteria group bacterium]|nr:hypothetical protein [Patescibacteria group bacterium]